MNNRKSFAIMDSFQVQCCFGTQDWNTMQVPAKAPSREIYEYDCKRCTYCGRFFIRGRDLEVFQVANSIPWEEIHAAPRFARVQGGPEVLRNGLRPEGTEVHSGLATVIAESTTYNGLLTARDITAALSSMQARARRIRPPTLRRRDAASGATD